MDTSEIHSIQPGQSVGDYTIERELGHGGMGTVYLVKHRFLDPYFAMKVLHLDDATSPKPTPDASATSEKHTPQETTENSNLNRFLREANIACALKHPNLIEVHYVGFSKEHSAFYIIMDYVAGGSLKARIKEKHTLSIPEALDIVYQVASALNLAEKKKIVHRDVKPDNILFTEDGTVKLADLGIAKISNGKDYHHLTVSKSIFGTPAYMSPEQANDSKDVDSRSDIYSLGIVLYEALCGSRPFTGENSVAILSKVISQAPIPDVRLERPDVPEDIVQLLKAMCEKDRTQRIQTTGILLNVLAPLKLKYRSGGLSSSTIDNIPTITFFDSTNKTNKQKPSRNILALGFLLCILVVGAIFAVFLYVRAEREDFSSVRYYSRLREKFIQQLEEKPLDVNIADKILALDSKLTTLLKSYQGILSEDNDGTNRKLVDNFIVEQRYFDALLNRLLNVLVQEIKEEHGRSQVILDNRLFEKLDTARHAHTTLKNAFNQTYARCKERAIPIGSNVEDAREQLKETLKNLSKTTEHREKYRASLAVVNSISQNLEDLEPTVIQLQRDLIVLAKQLTLQEERLQQDHDLKKDTEFLDAVINSEGRLAGQHQTTMKKLGEWCETCRQMESTNAEFSMLIRKIESLRVTTNEQYERIFGKQGLLDTLLEKTLVAIIQRIDNEQKKLEHQHRHSLYANLALEQNAVEMLKEAFYKVRARCVGKNILLPNATGTAGEQLTQLEKFLATASKSKEQYDDSLLKKNEIEQQLSKIDDDIKNWQEQLTSSSNKIIVSLYDIRQSDANLTAITAQLDEIVNSENELLTRYSAWMKSFKAYRKTCERFTVVNDDFSSLIQIIDKKTAFTQELWENTFGQDKKLDKLLNTILASVIKDIETLYVEISNNPGYQQSGIPASLRDKTNQLNVALIKTRTQCVSRNILLPDTINDAQTQLDELKKQLDRNNDKQGTFLKNMHLRMEETEEKIKLWQQGMSELAQNISKTHTELNNQSKTDFPNIEKQINACIQQENNLTTQYVTLKEKLSDYKKTCEQFQGQNIDFKKLVQDIDEKIAILNIQFEKYNFLEKLGQLKEQLKAAQDIRKNIQEQLLNNFRNTTLASLAKTGKNVQQWQDDRKTLAAQLTVFDTTLKQYPANLNDLYKQIEHAADMARDLTKRRDALTKELLKIKTACVQYQDKNEDIRKIAVDIDEKIAAMDPQDELDTCSKKIDGYYKTVKNKLQEEKDQLLKQVEFLEAMRGRLKENDSRARNLQLKLVELTRDIAKLDEDFAQPKPKLNLLTEQLQELGSRKNKLDTQKDAIRSELEDIKKRCQLFPFANQEFKNLEKQVDEKIAALDSHDALASCTTKIQRLEIDINKKIQKQDEQRKQLQELVAVVQKRMDKADLTTKEWQRDLKALNESADRQDAELKNNTPDPEKLLEQLSRLDRRLKNLSAIQSDTLKELADIKKACGQCQSANHEINDIVMSAVALENILDSKGVLDACAAKLEQLLTAAVEKKQTQDKQRRQQRDFQENARKQLDETDKAIKILQQDAKDLVHTVHKHKAAATSPDTDLAKLTVQLEMDASRAENLKTRQKKIENSLAKIVSDTEQFQPGNDAFKTLAEDAEKKKNDEIPRENIDSCEAAIALLQKNIRQKQAKQQELLANRQNFKDAILKRLAAADKAVKDCNQGLAALDKALQQCETALKQPEANLEKLNEQLEAEVRQLNDLAAKRNTIQNELTEIQKACEQCKFADDEIKNLGKRAEQQRAEGIQPSPLDTAREAKIAEIRKKIATQKLVRQKQKAFHAAMLQKLTASDENTPCWEQGRATLDKDIVLCENTLNQAGANLKKIEEQLKAMEKTENDLKAHYNNAKSQLAEITAACEHCQYSNTEISYIGKVAATKITKLADAYKKDNFSERIQQLKLKLSGKIGQKTKMALMTWHLDELKNPESHCHEWLNIERLDALSKNVTEAIAALKPDVDGATPEQKQQIKQIEDQIALMGLLVDRRIRHFQNVSELLGNNNVKRSQLLEYFKECENALATMKGQHCRIVLVEILDKNLPLFMVELDKTAKLKGHTMSSTKKRQLQQLMETCKHLKHLSKQLE